MARQNKTHPLFYWRRKNGNRSLQSLASAVGCTQSHLSEIENGNNEPSLALAAALHRETGLPMTSFVRPREVAQ